MQQSPVANEKVKKTGHKKKKNKWKTNIVDYIWCQACKVYLQNSEDMQEHERRMDHTLNANFQEVVQLDDSADDKEQEHKKPRHKRGREPKIAPLNYNIENLWSEIIEAEGKNGANFLYAGTAMFLCRPCHMSVHVTEISEHVHGLKHQEAISMEININNSHKLMCEEEQLWKRLHPAVRTHYKFIRIQDERNSFCFLCEKYVPATNTHNLLSHVAGKNHMKNVILYLQSLYSLLKGICLNPNIQSLLNLSRSQFKETQILQAMIEPTDDRHVIKLRTLLKKINSANKNKPLCNVMCKCLLCDQAFDSGLHWLNHLNELSHKQEVENLSKTGKIIDVYICCVCNIILCGNESDHHCVDEDGPVVPRVLVTGYGKEAHLESLYDVLQTYGTITNCAVTQSEAIVEFQEREAIRNILQDKVYSKENVLTIQPLTFKDVQDLPSPVVVNPCLYSVFCSVESFNCKINSICEIMNAVSNRTSEENLARFLEKELSKAFNKRVRTYLFGSRISGIAFQDSDADVFLDTGNMYRGHHGQEVSVQDNLVRTTAEALEAHEDCEQVVPVPKARTPIVKFVFKPTNTHCDIAFRHGLGCENTKLIRFYLSLDPSIKPLIGFLKFWMQLHGIYGSRNITGYAVVWLVIFFLQQLPNVNFPAVEVLQKHMPEKIIGGWNCNFNDDHSALTFRRIPYTMLQLVNKFFKYYYEFDFAHFVVCPLTGMAEPKICFRDNGTNLPDTMKQYLHQLKSGSGEKFSLTPISIQDPFELSHNISKGASREISKLFHAYCGLSAELLSNLEQGGTNESQMST